MRPLIAALMLCAAASAPALSAEPAKYPLMYKQMMDAGRDVGRPYFECDYTSRACERGLIWYNHLRVFEMIDDTDRKTIIGHGGCTWSARSWVCWDFDKGTYRGVVNGGHREGNMTVEDKYDWPRPIW
jgi:hypothetical protein